MECSIRISAALIMGAALGITTTTTTATSMMNNNNNSVCIDQCIIEIVVRCDSIQGLPNGDTRTAIDRQCSCERLFMEFNVV